MDKSRRQELLEYAETGQLRDAVADRLSSEAQDLLINVVMRYCEARRKRRSSVRPIAGDKR